MTGRRKLLAAAARGSAAFAIVAVLTPGGGGAASGPEPQRPPVCDRFASPSGRDSAPGTRTRPFRTVDRLVTALRPGRVGCLLGGTYVENVSIERGGRWKARLTVRSAPGTRALVRGYIVIRDSANDVTLRDLDIDGHDVSPPTVQINGDRVALRNLEITNRNKPGTSYNGMCVLAGPNFEASAANTALDLKVEQSRIHNCGDDAHEHAIYLESTRNARIVDSYLYDNPGYGVMMYPDAQGSLIEHTLIDGNSSSCKANLTFSGEYAGDEYTFAHASSNNTVRYSLITNSLCRYNIESYYPNGALTPSGNLVHNNCVWNAPWGNYGDLTTDAGTAAYSQRDNLNSDPLYVNRKRKDFRLRPGSACRGFGPSKTVVSASEALRP